MYELTYKIPLQFKVFMEHLPTKDQVTQAHYNTGLSDYEIMLIHSYCANKALERLESEGLKVGERFILEHEYYWLRSWKDELTFDNYGKAINHLTEVCEYWAQINHKYFGEWMLDAEEVIYERMQDLIHKGHRVKSERSYTDIKQKIGDI